MMKQQRGITFVGFLFVAVIAISLILAAVKVVPDYIEFSSVKKVIKRIGSGTEFNNMSKQEIRKAFDKSARAGYITVVGGNDLIFTTDASGRKVVSIEYEVIKPIAMNLSALMDFEASTAD